MTAGGLRCPGCAGRLRPWGYARRRWLRDRGRYHRVRPRRGRCTCCGRTHVILPDRMLLRRIDRVEVIGSALIASDQGVGVRRISRRLGLPPATVRGWIRSYRSGPSGRRKPPDGTGAAPPSLPSTVTALAASAPEGVTPGARWRAANLATNGRLLR